MFLLRMMFWLTVVVMLVPTGTDQPQASAPDNRLSVDGAIGAAAATVSDMAGFCDRNQQVCDTGSAAWNIFLAKAENAARLAYRMAAGAPGSESRSGQDPNADPQGTARHASGSPGVDTLRQSDLQPTWRGPGAEEI